MSQYPGEHYHERMLNWFNAQLELPVDPEATRRARDHVVEFFTRPKNYPDLEGGTIEAEGFHVVGRSEDLETYTLRSVDDGQLYQLNFSDLLRS